MSELIARREPRARIAFLWIAATLAVPTLISLFSGYHSYPVAPELAWRFSPVGLLSALFHGMSAQDLTLRSAGLFRGRLGWSFDYLAVFLKTCVAESPFYFYCFRKRAVPEFLAVLLGANLLTHPLVFFVFPAIFDRYLTAALSAEAFAALAEMGVVFLLLRGREGRRAAWLGAGVILAANLFSWEVGMYL